MFNGICGIFVFVTGVALLLVQYEPFKGVSADRDATMRLAANDKKGKIWLTGCLLVNTVFPLLSALVLFHFKVDKVVDDFYAGNAVVLWSMGNGKCNICNPYHYHLV